MARRTPPRLTRTIVVAGLALGLAAPAANAAFPGQNGALAIGLISEDRPAESTDFEIQIVRPDGSGRRGVLPCTSQAGDCPGAGPVRSNPFPGLYDPVRSPDGERLAIGTGDGLAVAATDGSGLRELTGLPPNAREPAWSPDGTQLVFTADGVDVGPAESDLYIVPVDGGVVRPLTATPGVTEREATWGTRPAADGGTIAYVRGRDVWTLRPDGEGARKLTGKSGAEPSFSPYATKIAFERRSQIYTVGVRGGSLDRATNRGGFSPTWSPDGKRIAFIRNSVEGRSGIYRMGPKGGALTRFANAIHDSSCSCTFERSLDWGSRR